VHACTNFLLEYHTTGVYEEAIDRLLTVNTEELQVWDYLVFVLFREIFVL
jgi:hypothetical protein